MVSLPKLNPFDKIDIVRRCNGFTSTQKLLLLIIATHIGKNNFCFLSLETLHKETCLSLSTVKENLRLLITHNVIYKMPPNDQYKSNRYGINFDLLGRLSATTQPPSGPLPAARSTRGGRLAATKRNINKIKEIKEDLFVFIEEKEKAMSIIRQKLPNMKKTT